MWSVGCRRVRHVAAANRAMAVPCREFGSVGRPLPVMSEMGIKLVVCDMAGTTVEEHGIVYKTLREAMVHHGLTVTEAEMHPWHGAAKGAVTAHFLEREPGVAVTAKNIDQTFEEMVTKAYSVNGATDLIGPDLGRWISDCQAAGIKVGLNTGYPVSIQETLLADLKLDGMVDCWVSASQVAQGRPYPYMVHRLMEQMGILDCSQVAKFGDTVNDVREGKNAGCGLVVGVLSGADSAIDLYEAGADIVVPNVTHIKPGMAENNNNNVSAEAIVDQLAAQVAERLLSGLAIGELGNKLQALPAPNDPQPVQESGQNGTQPKRHTLEFLRA